VDLIRAGRFKRKNKTGDCVVIFKFKTIVKDDERAFLTRDGKFERLLGPGRFTAFDYGRRLAAEVVKVGRT
jgi:hypothetical protein